MIDDVQLISKLMETGLATRDLLEKGRHFARTEETTLYDALIHHGLVPEKDVVQIASDVLNVPALDLSETPPKPGMANHLPREIADRCQVLPLELIDDDGSGHAAIRLAMVDPIDVMAMDEVASHTGRNIRPVLVGPSDLQAALKSLYAPGGQAEPVLVQMSGNANEDSWAALFNQPGEDEEAAHLEESAVLSIEMRDRPPTDVFEVVDEDLLEEDRFEGFSSPGMVAGSDRTQIGAPINLDEWELDDSFYDQSDVSLDDSDSESEDDEPNPSPQDQATVVVDDYDAYDAYPNQTRIGLGTRGLADLNLDRFTLDEKSDEESNAEDDEDAPADVEEESGDFFDEFQLGSMDSIGFDELDDFDEVEEISLEHSIEIALEPEEDSSQEIGFSDDDPFNFSLQQDSSQPEILLDMIVDEEEPQKEPPPSSAKKDPKETQKSALPDSLRAALKKATQKKKSGITKKPASSEKAEPAFSRNAPATKPSMRPGHSAETPEETEKPPSSALGRITLKRIAVPRFDPTPEPAEKKEPLPKEPQSFAADPATREISIDELASLTVGQPAPQPTADTQVGPKSIQALDQAYLAQALADLLVKKGIITVEELEATIEILKGS